MQRYYAIDLTDRPPYVFAYEDDAIQSDLAYAGVKNALALSDADFKVFKTESEATAWLSKYNAVLKGLDNKKICRSRELPAMLYKRRYIVQALLGEKTFTERHYRRNWKPGDLVNFHDQVFFLTVRIKKIIRMTDDEGVFYRYHYEVA